MTSPAHLVGAGPSPLVRLLEGRGSAVAHAFTCRALGAWAPFGLIGGINKRRPDAGDLPAARAFAARLAR
ncbi:MULTISPECIES: hypothetical protein [Streptomyces]|uniref:hypothetical protein n=1 Tax=Streptomyces TaxID=1883 RepID=UPI0006ADE91B|nr:MULTISPECIES: hypothetical protein [unclassified Streptomyces]